MITQMLNNGHFKNGHFVCLHNSLLLLTLHRHLWHFPKSTLLDDKLRSTTFPCIVSEKSENLSCAAFNIKIINVNVFSY